MPLLYRISFLVAVLTLSGCTFMFWPHTEAVAPAVSGTVLRAGKPVTGASVILVPSFYKTDCRTASSRYAAVTDSAGHFAIRGDRELLLFVVMGDRLDSWGICVDKSGNKIETLHAAGMGFPARPAEVICELTREHICQGA